MSMSKNDIVRMIEELENPSLEELVLIQREFDLYLRNREEDDEEVDLDKATKKINSLIEKLQIEMSVDADRICNEIKELLDNNEWDYNERKLEEEVIYYCYFALNNISVTLRIIVEMAACCVKVCTILPFVCERRNMIVFSYFLNKINSHIRYGSFNVESQTNQVLFEHCIPYRSESFDNLILEFIVDANLQVVDTYSKDVMRYANGILSEEEKNEILEAIKNNIVFIKENEEKYPN